MPYAYPKNYPPASLSHISIKTGSTSRKHPPTQNTHIEVKKKGRRTTQSTSNPSCPFLLTPNLPSQNHTTRYSHSPRHLPRIKTPPSTRRPSRPALNETLPSPPIRPPPKYRRVVSIFEAVETGIMASPFNSGTENSPAQTSAGMRGPGSGSGHPCFERV